jgi:hypothetical protein
MYIGTISARSKITLPGGFPISIESIVGMLCKRLWNTTACDCNRLNQYTAQELRVKITDLLTEMILNAVPGVNCDKPDLVNILINTIGISGGAGGLAVSLNFESALRAAASKILCDLAKSAMNTFNVIEPLVGVVVTFIQETACPDSSRNVTVNDEYGFGAEPEPTPPRMTLVQPTPAPQPAPSQGQTYTSTWSPTVFTKKKTNTMPLLVAGGVALAVSAVILSRRR